MLKRFDSDAPACDGKPRASHDPLNPPKASANGVHPPPVLPPDGFEFIDCRKLAHGDFRPDWLIKRILVRNEPAGMGGPMKALKTSLMIDMAFSLATGTPFLGVFEVPRPVKVAVVSGESGAGTLQKTAERVCAAKGLVMGDVFDKLIMCFRVPCLTDVATMTRICEYLAAEGVAVVFLDPLYLMLGDVDAASMFAVGGLLRGIAALFLDRGITPVILHHARKVLAPGVPMELQDLSHAGFAEFLRQYFLINRTQSYAHDGRHSLTVRCGGSAGHGGEFLVEVDEGVLDDDFNGRRWDVTVTDRATVPRQADRDSKAAAKNREKVESEDRTLLAAIDAAVSGGQPAATKNVLEKATGWQWSRLGKVIDRNLEAGLIEAHRWEKAVGKTATREVEGFRRPIESDHVGEGEIRHDPPPLRHDAGSGGGNMRDHAGECLSLKRDTPALPHDPDPRAADGVPAGETSSSSGVVTLPHDPPASEAANPTAKTTPTTTGKRTVIRPNTAAERPKGRAA